MRALWKRFKEVAGALTLITAVAGGGAAVVTALARKASASRVEALEGRTTAVESRATAAEVHYSDDDRLIDWLVQSTWMQHPELPPPPARRLPIK